MKRLICSVETCYEFVKNRELCSGHYARLLKREQARNRRDNKLNTAKIKVMRMLRDEKLTYRQIGSIFSVDQSTVQAVLKGKSWS